MTENTPHPETVSEETRTKIQEEIEQIFKDYNLTPYDINLILASLHFDLYGQTIIEYIKNGDKTQ